MAEEFALYKILESTGTDLNHFLSAFPTHLLLRNFNVVGTSGNANGKIEYVGWALPNVAKTEPKWLIKKLIYDANGIVTDTPFANGEAKFNKVFDDGSSNYSGYTFSTS